MWCALQVVKMDECHSASRARKAHLEVLAQRNLLALSRHHSQDVRALGVVPSKLQAPNAIKALAQVRLHCLWTLALHPTSKTVILCKTLHDKQKLQIITQRHFCCVLLLCIFRLLLLQARCNCGLSHVHADVMNRSKIQNRACARMSSSSSLDRK